MEDPQDAVALSTHDRPKKNVVIGFFGTRLDAGSNEKRWQRWRPTLSIAAQTDFVIDRLDLLVPNLRQPRTLIEDLKSVSPETEVVPHVVKVDDPWDFESVYERLHTFARDYPFDPENERYLVHLTTGTHVAQICLFLLTETKFIPAELLQSAPGPLGASPLTIVDLELARYERIAARFDEERQGRDARLKGGILTRNSAYNRLIAELETVAARSAAPILLSGPTGAGKTHLARRVYDAKRELARVDGAFVEVNCATLRGDTAMSTLFGHARGAFTGAERDRQGVLARADRGVLFLDEIGELGADEQAMLLRAIEDHRFLPVGADSEVTSRFQLIAGTNVDLREAVGAGRFRADLLARIDLWHFALPGLAERPEDIAPNLDYELERYSRRHDRRLTMTREAQDRFLRFAVTPEATWLGNFRDLAAAVERMGTLADGARISRDDVDAEVERLRGRWRVATSEHDDLVARVFAPEPIEMDRFDRVQLNEVLRVCVDAPTLSEAGRTLFAVSRERKQSKNDADRLRKYLAKHGLSWQDVRARLDTT